LFYITRQSEYSAVRDDETSGSNKSKNIIDVSGPLLRLVSAQSSAKDRLISVVRFIPVYAMLFFVFSIIKDPNPLESISLNYPGPLYNTTIFKALCMAVFILFTILTVWRFYVIYKFNNMRWKNTRSVAILILLFSVVSVVIFYVVRYLEENARYLLYMIFFVYTLSFSWFIFTIVLGSLRNWWGDRRRLDQATNRFNSSRRLIAATFHSFETRSARFRYVQWLEKEAAEPTNQEQLSKILANPWPDGRRPNAGDDEASILLARLDARWIGLDI
jgi:hypothetical protein